MPTAQVAVVGDMKPALLQAVQAQQTGPSRVGCRCGDGHLGYQLPGTGHPQGIEAVFNRPALLNPLNQLVTGPRGDDP